MAPLRAFLRTAVPVVTVLAAIILLWYAAAVWLNADWAYDQAERQDRTLTFSELVAETWSQKRPKLPAPHQVFEELWKTTVEKRITSKRSLIHHGWITFEAAALGFLLGVGLGIALAVGIVHMRAMALSTMPWIIASQTIPIIAIAPIVIVLMNAVGVTGLLPKAIISAYLSFFPVAVGMVKGLRSPDAMQLDLMKTYNASAWQIFWKLRWPAATPYLFTSLKIAMAAALVGAIVGELPSGAVEGLGARLLTGSYYGQTVMIWSALFAAAILAASLVGLIALVQRITLSRMGMLR